MGRERQENPVEERESARDWIPRGRAPESKPSDDGDSLGAGRDTLRSIVADTLPAGLVDRCARRSRDRAYLVDPERLARRALARLAWFRTSPAADGGAEPDTASETVLDEAIDAALEDLLRQDQVSIERSRALPCGDSEDHRFMERTFGLRPGQGLLAAVRFNELSASVRRPFFALVMEGRAIQDCSSAGRQDTADLARAARRGLEAILMEEPQPREGNPDR